MGTDAREDTILKLARDRHLAHRVLFGHRHPQDTPAFHREIIDRWQSPARRVINIIFRGGAKSTLTEEGVTIDACLRQFKNCVILGESEGRAVDRLRAIKHELNTNEFIEDLFGPLGESTASTWTDARIVLANGVCIQAMGRGQSFRGIKHLDARPDMLLVDDLEDQEAVATPEAKEKWRKWFFAVVLPAMDPHARIRINGTPLDPEALLENLARDPTWLVLRVPIKVRGTDGEWVSSWPGRFPLANPVDPRDPATIDGIEANMRLHGEATTFAQEYMCQAEDPSQKAFKAEQFKVEALPRTWQATYAMYDPARTVKQRSATTGVAIWSWVSNRLVVWEAYGRRWMPDEIIGDMFRVDDVYHPTVIGVEEDGLNEFILQPMRQEQVKRGVALPIRALKAPKGKIDFIKGLQPFFNAREVIFAGEVADLREQLLAFPTGEIDVPNALAYALRLRPGSPLYEDFSHENIVAGLEARRGPCWLAVNSRNGCTTAVLLQISEGSLHVLRDWVREGEPGAVLTALVEDAGLYAGARELRVVAGPAHFSDYDTVGLRAAAARVPVRITRGGAELTGREQIRTLLKRRTHDRPALQVAEVARWTLNAFASGYARSVTKAGVLTEFADEGAYKVLMEGLEATAALMRSGILEESDDKRHMAYTDDGRRYLSARG